MATSPTPQRPMGIFDRTIANKNDPMAAGIAAVNSKLDQVIGVLVASQQQTPDAVSDSSKLVADAVNSFTISVNKNENQFRAYTESLKKEFNAVRGSIDHLTSKIHNNYTTDLPNSEVKTPVGRHKTGDELQKNKEINDLVVKVGDLVTAIKNGEAGTKDTNKKVKPKVVINRPDSDDSSDNTGARVSRSLGTSVTEREEELEKRSSIGKKFKDFMAGAKNIKDEGLLGTIYGKSKDHVENNYGEIGKSIFGTLTKGLDEKIYQKKLDKIDEESSQRILESTEYGKSLRDKIKLEAEESGTPLSDEEIESRAKDLIKDSLRKHRENQKIRYKIEKKQRELDEMSEENGLEFELSTEDKNAYHKAKKDSEKLFTIDKSSTTTSIGDEEIKDTEDLISTNRTPVSRKSGDEEINDTEDLISTNRTPVSRKSGDEGTFDEGGSREQSKGDTDSVLSIIAEHTKQLSFLEPILDNLKKISSDTSILVLDAKRREELDEQGALEKFEDKEDKNKTGDIGSIDNRTEDESDDQSSKSDESDDQSSEDEEDGIGDRRKGRTNRKIRKIGRRLKRRAKVKLGRLLQKGKRILGKRIGRQIMKRVGTSAVRGLVQSGGRIAAQAVGRQVAMQAGRAAVMGAVEAGGGALLSAAGSVALPAAAVVAAGAGGYYLGTKIDKAIRDENGVSPITKALETVFKSDAQKKLEEADRQFLESQKNIVPKPPTAPENETVDAQIDKNATKTASEPPTAPENETVEAQIDKNATKTASTSDYQVKLAAEAKAAEESQRTVEAAIAASAAANSSNSAAISNTTVVNNTTFVRPDIRNQEPSFRRFDHTRLIF